MRSGELVGHRAALRPDWHAPDEVGAVLAELRARHPLVDAAGCHALLGELGLVARGHAFALQGGDCAEPFADSRPDRILAKAAQLEGLADLFEAHTALPVVRIGRFAGQYAKPRSNPTETLPDGSVVPVFLGDAVNGVEASAAARRPDVSRLLAAYDHAAQALDGLYHNRLPPLATADGERFVRTHTSHEALLLDFERALLRPDRYTGGTYASSGHFLWIGDRTRQPDGAHIHFAAGIGNPVGVKVGPTITGAELVDVVERLTEGHPPGRLTLIVRMGAAGVSSTLPGLIAALGALADRAIWMSDPMHANTTRNYAGQKTRVLRDALDEVGALAEVLCQHRLRLGGLHLEMTPDPVAECVASPDDVLRTEPLAPYESTCDPRLNPQQAFDVVRHTAALINTLAVGSKAS